MKAPFLSASRPGKAIGFAFLFLSAGGMFGQVTSVSTNKSGIVTVPRSSVPVLVGKQFEVGSKGARGERPSVVSEGPSIRAFQNREFQFCSTPNAARRRKTGFDIKATGSLGCGRQRNTPCYWANPILLVGFVNGTPELKAAVREVIAEWTIWANVVFITNDNSSFSGDTADIKISFNSNGRHNSSLGIDAWHVSNRVSKDTPTMNLGYLNRDIRSADGQILPWVRGTILHEFGHAMGLEHEHQNPSAGIRWNRDAVIGYLSGPPNNWDLRTIEFNVLDALDRNMTQFTRYDPSSIMQYSYPASWTLDGVGSTDNSVLSETDKAFIAEKYPRRRAAIDTTQYYRLTTWSDNRRNCLGAGVSETSGTRSYFPFFYACDGGRGQLWRITRTPAGDYRLTNVLLGEQLSMSDPGVEYYSAMSPGGNYRDQYWTITTLGPYVRLSSNLNGVLYSLTTATEPNTRTHMSRTGHWGNQLWELMPAGKAP